MYLLIQQQKDYFVGKEDLEGKYFLNEIPEILSNDLHINIESILNREKEKDDLRFSLGEPARTLRIVLQSVLDTNKVELKGIAVTIQDLTRGELNAAQIDLSVMCRMN